MKQIIQDLKTGETVLEKLPSPQVKPGHVLIETSRSLISAGTERMLVDFGKAGWIGKARQQPEKVRQVLDKMRTDGVVPTVESVFNNLDEPMPMGYCNAGVVLEVATGITDLQTSDRVASNGAHAEAVCIRRNLCAKIPHEVTDEEAAFTVLGSIALQGLRLASPTFGEHFMVFGLGLVGLLTVQLLRASGCPVLGADVSEKRLRLAEAFDILRRFSIESVGVDHAEVVLLAERNGLTAYDANYLWLTRRLEAALVTLDQRLENASSAGRT